MSEIRATTISDAAGTGPITLTKQVAAKSFINHDAGPTINDSFNVSSVTDNGTGQHRHTLTSSHSDKNYAVSGSTIGDSSTQTQTFTYTYLTGGDTAGNSVHTANVVYYNIIHHAGTAYDTQMIQVVTHGDLA